MAIELFGCLVIERAVNMSNQSSNAAFHLPDAGTITAIRRI